MTKNLLKKTWVHTFLNESTLPLFKSSKLENLMNNLFNEYNLPFFKMNTLKTKHAQFFQKNNLKIKLNKCIKLH